MTERLARIGGDVRIDSAPGRGTRVYLELPTDLAPEAVSAESAREAGRPISSPTPAKSTGEGTVCRVRVLLAAENAIVREELRRLLADQPDLAVVGEAQDVPQMVDLARATYPDVVVMGPLSPAANAGDAAYRVSADLPGTRIISLNMFDDSEKGDRMRQAGAQGYITRETAPAALLSAIRGQQ